MRETLDHALGRAARLRATADRLDQQALLAREREDYAASFRRDAAILRKLADCASRAAVPNQAA